MSDWTELLSEMSTCEPPGDLTARVLGDTQRAGGQTRARSRGVRARRLSRSLSIGLGTVAAVTVLVALAVAAHSRRETPSGPMLLTPANLLSAIHAQGFGHTYRDTSTRTGVCQNVDRRVARATGGNSIEYGYGGTLTKNPSGFPSKQVQTLGIFEVMPSAAIATACARESINRTLHPLRL
jgi:hypothetical protein